MADRRHEVPGPGGRALEVHEGGDPQGVPVLVHHGTPGSALLFEPWMADAEQRGIRLVGYSRPGYGGSTRHAGRSVTDCVADVTAIADALGFERFATWGLSGGGPHALATAALLGDRVFAAATLSSIGPTDQPDLDFFAGMGEGNIEEIGAAFEGEAALRPLLEQLREEMLAADADEMVEAMAPFLSDVDAALVRGPIGAFMHASVAEGLAASADGPLDDELAFVRPWGFDVGSIAVPVLVRQGAQDEMVPFGHGEWLAAHVPEVDAQLTPSDGHLSQIDRLGEVHAWLLRRLAQRRATPA